MADSIGSPRQARPSVTPAVPVVSVTARGTWVVVHDDARIANSAAELLNPTSVDDSVCHWIPVDPSAAKITSLRCKVPIATTAVGTSPIVRVYLGWGTLADSGSAPSDGTFRFERLDNASQTAAGLTLTFDATPTTSDQFNDATYFYSTSVFQTPTDLKGANYILVLVETAGACTASAAMPIEACFVN